MSLPWWRSPWLALAASLTSSWTHSYSSKQFLPYWQLVQDQILPHAESKRNVPHWQSMPWPRSWIKSWCPGPWYLLVLGACVAYTAIRLSFTSLIISGTYCLSSSHDGCWQHTYISATWAVYVTVGPIIKTLHRDQGLQCFTPKHSKHRDTLAMSTFFLFWISSPVNFL